MNFFKRIFNMIIIKTPDEVELIRQSALLVSKTLGMIAEIIKPGITTDFLDKQAEEFIRCHDAEPGFLGLYGFPKTLCTSVNEEVVHGIPSDYVLRDGDIISIDCGVLKNGFFGDHAYTFAIGEISDKKKSLLKATYESLYKGIFQIRSLNRIGDISFAIQQHVESRGYSVVRDLVGHGIGEKMHEAPDVPNAGHKRRGPLMKSGMVLAIEPMIAMGKPQVITLKDKWTVVTKDRLPAAHYEHNVAIVNGKPEVLSTYNFIEEALEKKGEFVAKRKKSVETISR
jgi:methionyl aminopeptidase